MQSHDDTENLLREKDARIEKLATELENWQNRLPPLIERFRQRNEEAERLEGELAEARERILELESAQEVSAANETRIEPVEHPDELTDGLEASNDPADDYPAATADDLDDVAATADDLDDVEALAEEVADEEEAFVSDIEKPVAENDSEPPLPRDSRDDLKMIKGVGPAIEKTLNEMGIFRFRQIADMSEYDIDRVARRLKGFHSRIYREDWIGQARALLDDAAHA
jgi:predicted flap endonuclease-1-like 5' DNA nuclease